jgi:hypothetical protein
MDEPRYVLNRNEGGESVLHKNPREECNTDDALDDIRVDTATGAALEMSGDIALCRHCYPPAQEKPA